MTDSKSPKSGISRRSFLKASAAVAGAALVGSGPSLAAIEASAADASSDERLFRGVCRPNCFGYCPLNVHVREGNIVKITPREHIDPYYNRVCLRGLSHVLRVYDTNRIKYPLRRVEGTERGANEWERISWEEAIDEIVEKFSRFREEFGDNSIAAFYCSGNMSLLHGNMPGIATLFVNLLNLTGIGNEQDMALFHGANRVCGPAGFFVRNEAKDFINSKTIFCWGDNLTSATIHEWHSVAEAVENGTKLIVIDPVFTETASKAHIWVPIRPGSDVALMLAMMNVILSEGAQNNTFLIENTVAPYLVDPDTHMFARMSDFGVEPIQGEPDASGEVSLIDPVAVWDEAQGRVVADPGQGVAASLRLSGVCSVNGKEYRTAYDYLLDEVAKYTPEYAETLTEVPAQTIIELAHYAMDVPVMHRVGYGGQAYGNGVHVGSGIATLCALLGNVGYPGAGFGSASNMYPGINYAYCLPTGPSTGASIPTFEFRNVMRTGKFMGKDYPIKALVYFLSNPVCCGVQTREYLDDAISNVEFVLTLDTVMTDTARYSDLVLPVAGWFEQEDVSSMGQTYYLQHNEKAIDPLFESRTDGDIMREICTRLGFGEYVQMTDDEFINGVLDSDYSKMLGGVTIERLRKEGFVSYYPKRPFIAWEGNMFTTTSKRMEFYSESPTPRIDMGQEFDQDRERLPRFFPPIEAWPDNEAYAKYPLVLNSERSKFQVHSQWYSTEWLKELSPEPTVKINPADAKARGIEDMSYVRVFNDRGEAVARAIYSEAMKPGMLVYPKGWQISQHKKGCWSELTSSAYDPVGVNSNFMDCLCEIEPWLEGE